MHFRIPDNSWAMGGDNADDFHVTATASKSAEDYDQLNMPLLRSSEMQVTARAEALTRARKTGPMAGALLALSAHVSAVAE